MDHRRQPEPGRALAGRLYLGGLPDVDDVFAVERNYGTSVTLEGWDGATWSLVRLPRPAGSELATLEGIACPGPTSCISVGASQKAGVVKTLVEQWDGTNWTIVPSPNPGGNSVLTAVTCLSPTLCFAAGSNTAEALVEQWNGTTWSAQSSPGSSGVSLTGISSASATSCFAAGTSDFGLKSTGYLEHWNGTAWSKSTFPLPAGDTYVRLQGLSCPTATTCFLVGTAGASIRGPLNTLIERWNVTKWTIAPSPNPKAPTMPANPKGLTNNVLYGVECASATDCMAVGSSETWIGFTGGTLVQRWDGSSWKIVPSPSEVTQRGVALRGVGCATTTLCFAVGEGGSFGGTLTEKWNGASWSIETPPLGGSRSELKAVACPTPTRCIAVGYNNAGTGYQTLTEQGEGTTWSIAPSPNPVGEIPSEILLNGVACATPTNCFAVGYYRAAQLFQVPLIEHWNGSTWGVVKNPAVGGVFTAVTCPTATSCYAVGQTGAGTHTVPLIEHWSGTTWSVQTAATTGASETTLNGVSCASDTNCVAVGFSLATNGMRTFTERWNGTSWIRIGSPSPTLASSLTAVSCASVNSCLAVGSTGSSKAPPLVERWNGAKWSTAASPAGTNGKTLSGISCPTTTFCMAVGRSATPEQTVVASWNGTKWTVGSTPKHAATTAQWLNGVSCTSASFCRAVGSYDANSSQYSLVQQYG